MDKDHRLDAPNNESLETIEQFHDHSELSALYFTGHKEWEGKEIISDEERQARTVEEQRTVTLSIRPWFAVIGLLVPLPLILFVVLLAAAFTYINVDNARFALPVVILGVASWLIASYLALRRVYAIFYEHAISATPFVAVLIALAGLGAQASYLITQPIQGNSFFINSLIVGGATLASSVVLCGILLPIWTSQHLDSGRKMGLIAVIVVCTLAVILAATLL